MEETNLWVWNFAWETCRPFLNINFRKALIKKRSTPAWKTSWTGWSPTNCRNRSSGTGSCPKPIPRNWLPGKCHNSTKIKGKQTNSDNSTKKPTKKKKKSFLLIGLAALILALLIFFNQRGPDKSESKDLAYAKKAVSGKAELQTGFHRSFGSETRQRKLIQLEKKPSTKGSTGWSNNKNQMVDGKKQLIVRMRKKTLGMSNKPTLVWH